MIQGNFKLYSFFIYENKSPHFIFNVNLHI